MILKLPTGDMRAPTFALVDTTAMAIMPSPNVWRVSPLYKDGATIKIGDGWTSVGLDHVDALAKKRGLPPEDLRAQLVAAIDEARVKWQAEAETAMARDYKNTHIILPGGQGIDTHATIEDIERAINAAASAPIVDVIHAYPTLPAFDDRGIPATNADPNEVPF